MRKAILFFLLLCLAAPGFSQNDPNDYNNGDTPTEVLSPLNETDIREGTPLDKLRNAIRLLTVPDSWSVEFYQNMVVISTRNPVRFGRAVSALEQTTYGEATPRQAKIYLVIVPAVEKETWAKKIKKNQSFAETTVVNGRNKIQTQHAMDATDAKIAAVRAKQVTILPTHNFTDGKQLIVFNNDPGYYERIRDPLVAGEYDAMMKRIGELFKPLGNGPIFYYGALRPRIISMGQGTLNE